MNLPFELVPHTADMELRAYGTTLEELFCNMLKGMFTSLKPQGPTISYITEDNLSISTYQCAFPIQVQAQNYELLLVDFLSECLYLSEVHRCALLDACITVLTPTGLEATVYGVFITGFEESEIKAVTYHNLSIINQNNLWIATVVFDI